MKSKYPDRLLKATNIYDHELAAYRYHQGQAVSMVNPTRVTNYRPSQLPRPKHDAADATLIARFCRDLTPSLWHPAPADVAKLQALSRRLAALEKRMTQAKNRLQRCSDDELVGDIQGGGSGGSHKALARACSSPLTLAQPPRLLVSITGIGHQMALAVSGERGAIENDYSARQRAALAGLSPQEFWSGTSVKGKTRLGKIDKARLRKALYFPALVMICCDPEIQAFRERLLAAGQQKMQVVGAVMHKLIRVIDGVLKSQQAFAPHKLAPQGNGGRVTGGGDRLSSTSVSNEELQEGREKRGTATRRLILSIG